MSPSAEDTPGSTRLLPNLVANAWPLVIILSFVFILMAFLDQGETVTGDPFGGDQWELRVGFYKRGLDEREYFEDAGGEASKEQLVFKLRKALKANNGRLNDLYYGDFGDLLERLESGAIDVAGELSPIEYVDNYRRYNFSPLVGIEYNDKAFYHSILFVRGGVDFCEQVGRDNVRLIVDSTTSRERQILYSDDEGSASGYYYPLSYLLEHDISESRAKRLPLDADIFLKVLELGKPSEPNEKNGQNNGTATQPTERRECAADRNRSRFVAGFLADFRLDKYEKQVECRQEWNKWRVEHKGSSDLQTEWKEDPKSKDCKKPWEIDDSFSNCTKALRVDKSDPIPNGVFVVSNVFRKKFGKERLAALIGVWKTVRPVGKPGSKITGWRSGVERDLKLVELHMRKVDQARLLRHGYQKYVAISIVVLIVLVSAVTLLVMGRGETA